MYTEAHLCVDILVCKIVIYNLLSHFFLSKHSHIHFYCCSYYKIPELDIIAMQIWDACLHKCNLICLFRLRLCSLWGHWKRVRESEKESWHERPQTPQMGFQSVLIYLSPWGLLSVVICLCLGWHNLCPSCFSLCSHRSSHACRIIHSSINSLTRLPGQCEVMKTERLAASCRWSWRVILCCCPFPVFQLLHVCLLLWGGENGR